jgi:hypothetical protein
MFIWFGSQGQNRVCITFKRFEQKGWLAVDLPLHLKEGRLSPAWLYAQQEAPVLPWVLRAD